jgi:hypothetical protein
MSGQVINSIHYLKKLEGRIIRAILQDSVMSAVIRGTVKIRKSKTFTGLNSIKRRHPALRSNS